MKDEKARRRKQNRRAAHLSLGVSAVVSLCLILSFFLRPLTVYATAGEAPDITGDKKYSIRVMMVYDDKTVEGGSFEAYRVGEIVKLKTPLKATEGTAQPVETLGGDTYRFWPTESLVKAMGFEQDEIDRINGINKDDYDAMSQLNSILSDKLGGSELNRIETAAQKEKLAKTLAVYVQSPAEQNPDSERAAGERSNAVGAGTGNARTGTGDIGDADNDDEEQETPDVWGDDHVTRENENGVVTFEDLRTGLYLFTQSEQQASPGYYPVEPFLVSVPVLDKEGYNYKVEAFPNDYEVKIYVKFRLLALAPVPPDPGPDPDPPGPDPGPDPPGPDPGPDPPGPDPDSDPEPESEPEPWIPAPDPQSPVMVSQEQTAVRKLPQTGQMNWPVPMLTVSGAAMFLAGMTMRLYGKKDYACTGKEDAKKDREENAEGITKKKRHD